MAAVTLLKNFTSTAQAASYGPTTSYTPTANALLFGIVAMATNTSSDWVLSDSLGGTWTKIARALKNGSVDFQELWVRTTLAAASAMTNTFSHATGNAQGCCYTICQITGMTLTGASAIRSSGKQENQAASGTPVPPLNQAALTGNPCIASVHNTSNPDGTTFPGSPWTDVTSTTHASPSSGLRTSSIDSGFTGTSVTWGSTSATAFSTMMYEFDTSSGAPAADTDFVGVIPI